MKITKEFIKSNLSKKGGLKPTYKKIFNNTSKEDLYCILHDIKDKPKCPCGKVPTFLSFSKGYNRFCSYKCSRNIEYNPNLRNTYQKISNTNKKVWGKGTELRFNQLEKRDENGFRERVAIKGKETKLKRYGAENYNNKEKYKETCLERYSVNNGRLVKGVSKKIEDTFLKKYGYKNNLCNPLIREKAIKNKNIKYLSKTNLTYKDLYYKEVLKITNQQNLYLLKNFDKRGLYSYHLDHRYSIIKGFRNNILPCYIGNINNLEMLPAKENYSKHSKCSITLDKLIKEYKESL